MSVFRLLCANGMNLQLPYLYITQRSSRCLGRAKKCPESNGFPFCWVCTWYHLFSPLPWHSSLHSTYLHRTFYGWFGYSSRLPRRSLVSNIYDIFTWGESNGSKYAGEGDCKYDKILPFHVPFASRQGIFSNRRRSSPSSRGCRRVFVAANGLEQSVTGTTNPVWVHWNGKYFHHFSVTSVSTRFITQQGTRTILVASFTIRRCTQELVLSNFRAWDWCERHNQRDISEMAWRTSYLYVLSEKGPLETHERLEDSPPRWRWCR